MAVTGSVKGGNVLRGEINRLYELRGYSAYDIAVIEGFEGTVEEWLASLKGDKGDPGEVIHTDADGEILEQVFVKKDPVYQATPDTILEVLQSADQGAIVQLAAGEYGLLTLVGKEAYPEDLTIVGGEGVTVAGISITSGIKDQEVNSAYYNLPDHECCNTDVTNATLPSGLTFKNIHFIDSFSLRNARCDNLSFIGCVFARGTYLFIDPNRMYDEYGGDFTAEKANFDTRPFCVKLTPKNLIVRECVFEDATPLEDGSTHIETNCSAIQVKGICGITIYKNTIKGAMFNGVSIGGNDIPLYDNYSSGDISVTNNMLEKTTDRGIRLHTIKNAKVVVLRNQLVNSKGNNLQSGLIKASRCKNTEFYWDGTTTNSGESNNYIPEVDALGNVIYAPEGVAKIAFLLTANENGGIDVEDCICIETDHIVAQGVSGAWTYRKWASGVAECWISSEQTAMFRLVYPFPFVGKPKYYYTFSERPMYEYKCDISIPGGVAEGNYLDVLFATSDPNATINWYFVGKWK